VKESMRKMMMSVENDKKSVRNSIIACHKHKGAVPAEHKISVLIKARGVVSMLEPVPFAPIFDRAA
jgi:hypothetical protein